MEIPNTITKNEDKIKFLYRVLEKLRLEHNEKGKDFREKKLTQAEWDKFDKEFKEKVSKVYEIISPIKKVLGMTNMAKLYEQDPTDSRLSLKGVGKETTTWDNDINLKQI